MHVPFIRLCTGKQKKKDLLATNSKLLLPVARERLPSLGPPAPREDIPLLQTLMSLQ